MSKLSWDAKKMLYDNSKVMKKEEMKPKKKRDI